MCIRDSYYLLSPVYEVNKTLDASCCAILFCKALELQMKDCFETSLKSIYPDVKIRGQGRGKVELKDATSNELTLGAFQRLLASKSSDPVSYTHLDVYKRQVLFLL